MFRPLRAHEIEWRDRLRTDITAAFAHVHRGKGAPEMMSWSESVVVDHYGSAEERAAARRADLDTHWTQLIDDARWRPFGGIGGWVFLERPAYRYYVPPTMMRFLMLARGSDEPEEKRTRTLTRNLDDQRFAEVLRQIAKPPPWSPAERASVARFIWCMERWTDPAYCLPGTRNPWRRALRVWREWVEEM
ncbi:MAG TPA: hypothetical protein VK157_09565 [Phycisphaerales bacterium]|nr:hypothetical protein [Phycisphaerales bacterium]